MGKNKGIMILTVLLSNVVYGSGKVYWQENGVCICESTLSGGTLDIVSDGCGGAIVVWADNRGDSARICAQRVDSSGNILWDTNGVIVMTNGTTAVSLQPKATIDGKSGVIVTWSYYGYGIYAARVDSSGIKRWETIISKSMESGDMAKYPSIIPDGQGGAIIGWVETYYSGMDFDSSALYIQKVDNNGGVKWSTNGICVISMSWDTGRILNDFPALTTDSNEGATIVWTDSRNNDYNIYAQRIDSNGIISWNISGKSICIMDSIQSQPFTVSFSRKTIMVWNDKRNGDFDIYGQRLNIDGEIEWGVNGIPICATDSIQGGGVIVSDSGKDYIIIWLDNRGGSWDFCTQKVDSSGVALWLENGICIGSVTNGESSPSCITDKRSGAIITWSDYRAGNWDIYAQRVDSSGVLQWEDRLPVCTTFEDQWWGPRVTTDGRGGAIIAFGDSEGPGANVYAQRVGDAFGVEEIDCFANARNDRLEVYPSFFIQSTVISYQLPDLGRGVKFNASIKIYDLGGRLIETLIDGEQKAGNHKIRWNTKNVRQGIYFCQLNVGDTIITKKLILMK